MTAIFRDDSTIADKRDAAIDRLMGMCPQPLRVLLRPMVISAIDQASEAELDALTTDVERIYALAESGDIASIGVIAKRYGATDAQIATFLPLA